MKKKSIDIDNLKNTFIKFASMIIMEKKRKRAHYRIPIGTIRKANNILINNGLPERKNVVAGTINVNVRYGSYHNNVILSRENIDDAYMQALETYVEKI